MSALVEFPSELREWLGHNLSRGCNQEALVESMAAQGFDVDIARGIVAAFHGALARGEPLPCDQVVIDIGGGEAAAYRTAPTRLAGGNRLRVLDRDVDVLMRLHRPCVAVLGNVLAPDECARLVELGKPRLAPSTITDPATGADRVATERGSEGMFFRLCENDFIATIDRRLSALMGMPVEHGEGLQLLHYGQGRGSSPHYDFLVPQNERNRASLARSGQRISTLVVYLNDVPAGGATDFPELGLCVTPRQGNAVYFEYANNTGQVDHATLHAGAPVLQGDKWVLTKWMRARPFMAG